MPGDRDAVPDGNGPGPGVETVFVERTAFERGFAKIFEASVAPRLPSPAEGREGTNRRRAGRAAFGAGSIALLWAGLWFWEAGRGHLGVQIAAGFATLVLADLFLRRARWPRTGSAGSPRGVLVEAVRAHAPGLVYQHVAGRRLDHDRFVALGLAPRCKTALVEGFFAAERRGAAFRAVDAEFRDERRAAPFRGMLVEIAVPRPFSGLVAVLRRRDGAAPPGAAFKPVKTAGHPAFDHMFQVYATETDEAARLLDESAMTALTRFDEQLDGAPFQAGFAFGHLLLAIPWDRADEAGAGDGVFDPVGDAHRLLARIAVPFRLVDTLHGIDPETGGRYRAR